MRKIITALVFILSCALVYAGESSEGVESHRLFELERSKGPSIIAYDALTRDGELIEDDPIDVYWEHPKKNNQREELNWIERWKAFGVDMTRRFDCLDSCDIVMRANKKPLRIVQRDGRWMALTYVNRKVCELLKVYVATDESGIMPEVLYVKVTGRVRWSGEVITETIRPD